MIQVSRIDCHVSASTLDRLRRRGAGAEVVMGLVATGSGRGGGDGVVSLLSLLPTLGSMEADDSVEHADEGEVAP